MSETISARFCAGCLTPLQAADRSCPVCWYSLAEPQETIPAFARGDVLAAGLVRPEHLPAVAWYLRLPSEQNTMCMV
jgi:hypothetical protein